ncbi:thioredoxin family protein [Aeromicrobium sp.]|uniref:thioredoxin family protein n=1 Tax=Aeromicrobium sp. TaxID=1871063 RepID=UPI003D6C32BA
MTGFIVLIAALVFAACVAWGIRSYNGRFNSRSSVDALTADDLGGPLGERATLIHFSSAFCAPCRTTRILLEDVADRVNGVAVVEIDAESHLELVRRFDVMRTPTVMVLDPRGAVVRRASGLPRRDQVLAALAAA